MENIENNIEQYYREIVADDIDNCLFHTSSSDLEHIQQTYWFNQGMAFASMIARWGGQK